MRPTSPRRGRRPVPGLSLPLPRLPAPDGERLRDAGRVPAGSGFRRRALQRLRASLGRGGQEGACLPLLPRRSSTVFYREPDVVVVMVGSFADPTFPQPTGRATTTARHHWIALPESIQRYALTVGRYGRSTRPADTRTPRTGAASSSLPIPAWRTSLQRCVLREPRGTNDRRGRAPSPGDRAVGRLPRHGGRGLRLRSGAGGAAFQGAVGRLAAVAPPLRQSSAEPQARPPREAPGAAPCSARPPR